MSGAGRLPTVKIVSGNGFVEINECDFNEKEHKLYSDKPIPKKTVKKVVKSK